MDSTTLPACSTARRMIQQACLPERLLPLLQTLRRHLLTAALLLLPGAVQSAELRDPAATGPHEVALSLESWTDASRQRTLPLRIVRPRLAAPGSPTPVILFSHGLGGSREGGRAWGDHWASHGYLVIHLQHPGSDSAVWQGAGDRAAMMQGLRAAMSPQQFIARVADVGFVLDELARRVQSGDPVVGRADLSLTGTLDTSVASKETAESRQWPFERMPGPDKYLLVLDGADHATFGGQSELRALRRSRPVNGDSDAADASIRAVSLMFWNAHLSGNDRAREWLTGGAFVRRLGPSDRWRVKR